MSVEQALTNVTFPSNADLSAGQYKFVTINSSHKIALVAAAGGAGIGVLQNDPAAADREAVVAVYGVSRVLAGGTVATGNTVQSDANGDAIVAASGDAVFGTCVRGGVDGDYILVLLNSQFVLP